jgi:hypothetical protein
MYGALPIHFLNVLLFESFSFNNTLQTKKMQMSGLVLKLFFLQADKN